MIGFFVTVFKFNRRASASWNAAASITLLCCIKALFQLPLVFLLTGYIHFHTYLLEHQKNNEKLFLLTNEQKNMSAFDDTRMRYTMLFQPFTSVSCNRKSASISVQLLIAYNSFSLMTVFDVYLGKLIEKKQV